MANKAISELPEALNVNNQDLFVLEQGGLAKKLPAETFITEQGIIDALAEALDGHGGIQSVTLSSVSGRIRTYLITFTDGSATTFQVYDGTTIERIAKTSTAGLVDTYTVFMNDGTTTFFTVTNGADGTVSEAMLNDALKNKAPVITETTESSAIANFTDGADDMPIQSLVAEIEPVQDLNGYDAPWPAGSKNQLIFKTISGNIESSGKIVSTQDFYLLVAEVTANQTYVYSLNGVAVASGGIVAAYYSSEPDINSISYDGQRITTGQNPFIAPITGYVAIRAASGSDVRRQIEAGSTATAYYPYSNICPISGHTEVNVTRTGKNLYSAKIGRDAFTNLKEATHTTNSDDLVITMIDSANSGVFTATASALRRLIYDVLIGTAYTYSFDIKSNSSGNVRCGIENNGAKNVAVTTDWQRVTISVSSGNTGAFIVYNTDGGGARTVTVRNLQIELGSATAYEPYQGETVTTDLTQTVYGGTLDAVSGALTVTHLYADLGDFTWTSFGNTASYGGLFYSDNLLSVIKHDSNNETYCVCSMFGSVPNALNGWIGQSNEMPNNTVRVRTTDGRLYVRADSHIEETGADFKTAMSGVQLCYELATPQTYLLTPQEALHTLYGLNNVWADTGNVSVTYVADTKMFIEKLTMPTEDDLVANQAITSGKYFMIGNSLYLALANIASGAQITIGTNAQRVSLADALNAINS